MFAIVVGQIPGHAVKKKLATYILPRSVSSVTTSPR